MRSFWRALAGYRLLVLACLVLAGLFLALSFQSAATIGMIGINYLIPVGFWSALLFIARYSMVAPWWKNSMGRMLVALDLAVALALPPSVLRRSLSGIWRLTVRPVPGSLFGVI